MHSYIHTSTYIYYTLIVNLNSQSNLQDTLSLKIFFLSCTKNTCLRTINTFKPHAGVRPSGFRCIYISDRSQSSTCHIILTNNVLTGAVTIKHVLKFDMLIFKGSHYSRTAFITLKHLACSYYSIFQLS